MFRKRFAFAQCQCVNVCVRLYVLMMRRRR
jgi:hypothetical protein